MSPRTILTLSNGKGIDLLAPKVSDIEFAAIAEHLAKEARYNGATKDRFYSVAQHSVQCADAALDAGEGQELAIYLLLHDAHEAFLKDDTTPKKNALATIARVSFGVVSDAIMQTFSLLTDRFDAAIHEAAGIVWPPPSELEKAIKHYDLTLFVTEWRDLMGNQPHPDWAPYEHIKPLKRRIIPRPWWEARAEFYLKCRELLPALRKNPGAPLTESGPSNAPASRDTNLPAAAE
jgi:5'-deoxynucleotidase YfbR-like HD superfamily hydrolase